MPDKFIFTEPLPATPGSWDLIQGDALTNLPAIPDSSVRCIVTSPPYFRKLSYGCGDGEHGLESGMAEYLRYQAAVATELRRIATPDANLFLVIQDSYNHSGSPGGDHRDSGTGCYLNCKGPREADIPRKAQLLIPEWLRIVYGIAGWLPTLRIVWNKEDARRGAVDRPSYSYEEVLVFAASPDHYWNREAVLTEYKDKSLAQLDSEYDGQSRLDYGNGENPSDTKRRMIKAMNRKPGAYLKAVWHIPSGSQPVVHVPGFGLLPGEDIRGIACFPLLLAKICISLGSAPGDRILDPFAGMGSVAVAGVPLGRHVTMIELGSKWCRATRERMKQAGY